MPSRTTIAVIVLFWLGAASWYVWREVVPYWGLEGIPPYHIDLTDEVGGSSIDWQVFFEGEPVGKATTRVSRREWRQFEISSAQTFPKFMLQDPQLQKEGIELRLKKLSSEYVVTREGELLEVSILVVLHLKVPPDNILFFLFPSGDTLLEVKGVVEEGILKPNLFLNGQEVKIPGAPALRLPPNGRVLNPMMPFNRIPGLNDGQAWREPMLNPLGDMAGWLGKNVAAKEVFATVSLEPLTWNGDETSCYLIEYHEKPLREGNLKAKIWVRARDGLVLRQEAYEAGKKMTLVREPVRN